MVVVAENHADRARAHDGSEKRPQADVVLGQALQSRQVAAEQRAIHGCGHHLRHHSGEVLDGREAAIPLRAVGGDVRVREQGQAQRPRRAL